MFKPNPEIIQIGSIQILAKDISSLSGTITKGSKVKVIDNEERGYSIMDLDSGHEMFECGFNIFEANHA